MCEKNVYHLCKICPSLTWNSIMYKNVKQKVKATNISSFFRRFAYDNFVSCDYNSKVRILD